MSNELVEIIEVADTGSDTPVGQHNLLITHIPVIDPNQGYRITDHAEQRLHELTLTYEEWRLVSELNSVVTFNELTDLLAVPVNSVFPAFLRLISLNIIEPEDSMTYEKFRSIELPSGQKVDDPMEESGGIGEADIFEEEYIVDVDLNEYHHEEPAPSTFEEQSEICLRCLVDIVCQFKGNDRRGKLAVYRIFLQVPRDDFVALGFGSFLFLSKDADIVSDGRKINSELMERLIQATEKELGRHPRAIMDELIELGRLPGSCV